MSAEYVTETLSANLSDRAEAQLREENERLLAANRYSLDMFNMINADYQKLRAENDRYRAALVEITSFCDVRDCEFVDWRYRIKACEQIALNALAVRTESGPLSEDSGPIAEDGR